MHLSNATATTLLLAFTRLTNPSKDATKIPEYYNTQIMPSFAAAHNATLALGYTILPPVNASTPSKWTYLAVYKTSANATVSAPRVEGGSRAGEGEIGPEDVETEVSAWSPVQVFEGLREKRGDVPAGRPGVACVVRIEPGEGDGKGEARVEDWYRFQVPTPFYPSIATFPFRFSRTAQLTWNGDAASRYAQHAA